MFQRIIGGVAGFMLIISAAVASDAPLTQDQAQRFVDSLESVEALGKELKADGKIDKMHIEMAPKAGETFKPFSKAVDTMKTAHPADYAKLGSVVKSHGFTQAAWGQTGDRVMVAYLAIKMEAENPQAMAQMQAMDKSMLDMLPADMKAQFTQAMVMMETVKNAPDADKKTVAKVKDQLDAYMERQVKQ